MRPALGIAVGLAIASALLDGGVVRHRALAGPIAIGRALVAALRDGSLAGDLGATLGRTLAGVALGAFAGTALGLAAAASRRALEPSLDFLRAVPPLLVLPLLFLALGYGEPARVLAIAWAAALASSLHIGAAAARPGGERVRALRAMGASRLQIARFVGVYELAPPALVALRQAFATGLVVAVVSEMVMGAEHGLGARAVSAQIAYDTPGLWAVLCAAGAAGWSVGRAILALERRVAHWSG